MSDIVKLLPDFVANQIAAGEVIQRPASVVKELIENALDAGATDIQVVIKDAGRTLIQITDNGKGMSPADARMAFERHATSKITHAEDLFSIRTMGFRGEALASIAAVAAVELKTKRSGDDIGTLIKIAGSDFIAQEPTATPVGANFAVKNLFYNIPARRKFLKSDSVEYRNITNEIYRIVLAHPDIAFTVTYDNNVKMQLQPENLHRRIVNVFGKNIDPYLVHIHTETSIVNIDGFIVKPEKAKKTNPQQYFFCNGRFMIHPYFRKAVLMAFERLIQEGEQPSFFIFFDIDPADIDVNIHPTKTDIKFEDESSIFQILNSTVKEALGKFILASNIDFSDDITRNVHLTSGTSIRPPQIRINPDYDPFSPHQAEPVPKNWETLYQDDDVSGKTPDDFFLPEVSTPTQGTIFQSDEMTGVCKKNKFLQVKNRYIITSLKSGILIIDYVRAHEQILFEEFLQKLNTHRGVAQKTLFPVLFEPSPTDHAVLVELMSELNGIGFEILMVGKTRFEINAIPIELLGSDPLQILEHFIAVMSDVSADAELVLNQKIAMSLAKSAAVGRNKILTEEEMEDIFSRIMACEKNTYTYEGKKITEMINVEEIMRK